MIDRIYAYPIYPFNLLNSDLPISIGVFCGRAKIAWTDSRLLKAYTRLCGRFGTRIGVISAFKLPCPGNNQSLHFAGLALDLSLGGDAIATEKLRSFCISSGDWSYVEPPHIAPTWVHVELSVAPKTLPRYPYPMLEKGCAGAYVFTLQALLCSNDEIGCPLTGRFDNQTKAAVMAVQRSHGLAQNGRVDYDFWRDITASTAP